MFAMITPETSHLFTTEIAEIGALRHRVFVERLGWVPDQGGIERDSFDDTSPTYLAYRHPTLGVVACVRFLPTTGPNMLRDCFPQLMGAAPAPADPLSVESSRFCVDTDRLRHAETGLMQRVTTGLLAAMLEYGLYRGYRDIVTVTDLRVERIVRTSGWPIQRLGEPCQIGDTRAVAVAGPVTRDALQAVRDKAGDHTVKLYTAADIAA